MRVRSAIIGVAIGFGACASPKTAPPEPVPAPLYAPPVAIQDASSNSIATDAAGEASAPVVVDASVAVSTPATCEKDADCGWDDPCTPSACGKKLARPAGKNCGKPGKPLGECRCAAGTCAFIRPEDTRNAERISCRTDGDCAFDATAGVCIANPSPASLVSPGIDCQCDTLNHFCKQMWVSDVPCKSFLDCSWRGVGAHPIRPVPSWFAPRSDKNPVRPCRDAERDSVCVGGKCVIHAWKC
jgi:hypothetical protein